MFGLFKKKTEKEKLLKLYKEKLQKSFVLSKSNRKESDRLASEANDILNQIDALEENDKLDSKK